MAFDFLGNLAQLGFFDIILPWTLFFAIVYGLLSPLKLFGDKSDKINMIIAIAIAFFGVNYTSVGVNVGMFLTNLFGVGGLLLSIILLAIIVLPLLGLGKMSEFLAFENLKKHSVLIALFLGIIGVGAFFITGGGRGFSFNAGFGGISSDLVTTVLVLAVMLGVILFVFKTAGSGGGSDTPPPAGKK
jgi:hypothetical protein